MRYEVGIFYVCICYAGYYIQYKNNICDSEMAYCLNLPKEEYIEILKLYNAKKILMSIFL